MYRCNKQETLYGEAFNRSPPFAKLPVRNWSGLSATLVKKADPTDPDLVTIEEKSTTKTFLFGDEAKAAEQKQLLIKSIKTAPDGPKP